MTKSWETAEIFKTPMEICWQFDYAIGREKLKALYSKAKRNQWDAESTLKWDYTVDPARPVMGEESFSMFQVPLVKRLSTQQQSLLRAHSAAHQLSQILHGEQGAMMTAAALTHAVPDHDGKLYSATQTMDEARHVEVFSHYIRKLAIIYPMGAALKRLIDLTLAADHWVKMAIGMNMVVEGLALGTFQNVLHTTSCELLRSILQGVIRDEARHVAFGGLYVRETIAGMHADQQEDVADFAFEAIEIMRTARSHAGLRDAGFLLVLDSCNIDRGDFFKSVLDLAASGTPFVPPRDQVHAVKELMMPALVRVGAVTERTRQRFAQVGVQVWDDSSTLERFEAETTSELAE
jgi:hypothetical protein